MADRPLAAGLLLAADWFNDALLSRLSARGWPRLSRNQSQVFPLITRDGSTSPSDLARGLGITRQSAHALLGQLIDLGILAQSPDPLDGRRTTVHLTDRGHDLADDARAILADLEAALAARIGASAVDALASALAQDWGEAPHGRHPDPGHRGARQRRVRSH